MSPHFGSFEDALANRYRFESELGRGGMGTVYRAQDLRLHRPVAIKMLHRVLTNEIGIARFKSEVRIAAALRHPSIVSVHDYDEAGDRLFYVMDFLDGITLRERIRNEGQLPIHDAVEITAQVAGALQYAHDQGVVHRDIKPENIILTNGWVWLVDFGLARAISNADAERLTASGITVGTPQYLSPEQAAAEPNIGPATDQYALACVLYEMLVGEPPFAGPTAAAIAIRHMTDAPAKVRAGRAEVTALLEAAVGRALEKAPENRFPSVSAFATRVRAAVEHAANRAKWRRVSYRALLAAVALGVAGAFVLKCSAV